jgi:Domain of unknown function (DUF4405)
MNPVSREWATPLTLGSFALMAATGLLMFFHLDTGVQKVAHEWLGWGLVAAVALHAVANGKAFLRHLQAPGRPRVILAVCTAALAGSFFVSLPGGEGASPPVLAMRAVAQALLSTLAPLTGKPVAQLRRELAAAGVPVASDDASIDSAVNGNRERLGRAMRVAFAPAATPR